jgi:predicted Na+-dependent transporter
MKLRALLLNNGFLIILALAIGISTGFSYRTKESTYLLLGTIMALSVTQIDFERMKSKGKRGLILPIALVYVVSPIMTLVPGYILIRNSDFLRGFIIMAIVPSAISLIAFTKVLDGDVELALAGTGSVYLASLFLMPFLGKVLLGADVSALSLLNSILLLVVIPFLVSRIFVWIKLDEHLGERKKPIISVLFFILVVNIVGARRDAFFIDPYQIGIISLICVLKTSFIGTIVYLTFRKLGVDEWDARTYTLFSGFKNGGLAVALSVALFNPAVAVPAAISVIFDMGSISYYELLFKRMGKNM